MPFAVRSTVGARHEAARNGSDQSLAIRWLWEQGMGWLGTLRPLPALVTGLADVDPDQGTNLSTLPLQISGASRDVPMMASRACTSIRLLVIPAVAFDIERLLADSITRGVFEGSAYMPTNRYMQSSTQALPMPNSYTPIVLGPSSASPNRE